MRVAPILTVHTETSPAHTGYSQRPNCSRRTNKSHTGAIGLSAETAPPAELEQPIEPPEQIEPPDPPYFPIHHSAPNPRLGFHFSF